MLSSTGSVGSVINRRGGQNVCGSVGSHFFVTHKQINEKKMATM